MVLLVEEKQQEQINETQTKQERSLQEKFLRYHEKNPEIYLILKRLAFEAKSKGRSKIGIKMLWEVMRWERFVSTDDPEGYKLNNNYPSRYARLLMDEESDLKDIFEVRKLRA